VCTKIFDVLLIQNELNKWKFFAVVFNFVSAHFILFIITESVGI
jgi:hypothetical protein